MDDHPTQLSAYGSILLMGIIGVVLVCVLIFLAKIIAPNKPNAIKESTYECGEETVGSAWVQFNPRFYVIALIFLLFDVELVFIFPWSVVFGNAELIAADSRWGWFTLAEMAIFLAVLIVGLMYVWRKGDLNWIKPSHSLPVVAVNIPADAYIKLNRTVYPVKDFKEDQIKEANEVSKVDMVPKVSAGFKPRFRKSEP